MATNNFFKSDLYQIHSIVQSAMILYPKELVIETLRDFFSHDSWYSYHRDQWGFAKTVDLTNVPLAAGLEDNITTRLLITDAFRREVQFYPSIIVRSGGSASVPVSFNREASTVQWTETIFEDGYGNQKLFRTPKSFIFSGAWEGSINIDVLARDIRARDDLVDLISMLFVDVAFNDLVKSGLIIKGVSAGAPFEISDRSDYIYKQTVTLQTRSEWKRAIPVGNIIDIINTSIEFGAVAPLGPVAPNLTINTSQTFTDMLNSL